MKTTLSQFFSYLENLAVNHKDIAHTPDNPSFHKFYDAESMEEKLRSLIQRVPCILIKDYDFRFQDNGADNVHKIRSVDVIVIEQINRDSTLQNVHNVWERTEEIGDELIMRMKYDKRRLVPAVINFNLSNVQGVPANIGFGGLFGTMYSIPVGSVITNDPDKTKWTDLDEPSTV